MARETLVLIKPDAWRRGLIGEIITRIERKGFRIVASRCWVMGPQDVGALYAKFRQESFFSALAEFMMSGHSMAMIVEDGGPAGEREIVNSMRCLIGACDDAPCVPNAPGTIRGDYGMCIRHNVIHASDSKRNAEHEIRLFFPGHFG